MTTVGPDEGPRRDASLPVGKAGYWRRGQMNKKTTRRKEPGAAESEPRAKADSSQPRQHENVISLTKWI